MASESACVRDALAQRYGQACLWLGPQQVVGEEADGSAPLLHLHCGDGGFVGDLACRLPLPLASESCGTIIVQHMEHASLAPRALLEECERVLIPGGRLWLLALNPLSPYRLRWRGQGLQAHEPVTWRRWLREAGVTPDSLTRGLGPSWAMQADTRLQDGVGLRAVFLLRAEKRRIPLTPLRKPRMLGWQTGTPA